MVDERLPANPRRELTAAQANLLFWQLGGLGLCAPLALIVFDCVAEELIYGAFAWDGTIYENDAPPAYLGVVKNGTGDFTFTFDASLDGIPDENGDPTPTAISISSIKAQLAGLVSSAHQSAETVVTANNVFTLKTYSGSPIVQADLVATIMVF